MSTKVSASILRGQKTHFRPSITFPATSGQMAGHDAICQKSPKSRFWPKNSNFYSIAGSVRESDIWPEMSPWGVLEPFCTRNRYLNPFRSNFKQFWKNRFFGFFSCGSSQKIVRKIFYGPRNFDIEISTGPNASKLFQKKKAVVNFRPFLT